MSAARTEPPWLEPYKARIRRCLHESLAATRPIRVSAGALRTLAVMATFSDGLTGATFVGNARLAEARGISGRSIRRHLRVLEKAGKIKLQGHRGAGGVTTWLLLPPDAHCVSGVTNEGPGQSGAGPWTDSRSAAVTAGHGSVHISSSSPIVKESRQARASVNEEVAARNQALELIAEDALSRQWSISSRSSYSQVESCVLHEARRSGLALTSTEVRWIVNLVVGVLKEESA